MQDYKLRPIPFFKTSATYFNNSASDKLYPEPNDSL